MPPRPPPTITQRLVATGREDFEKRETLRDLINGATDLQNAIVFCNRKRDVAVVHRSLLKHGFNVAALHGDMDQRSRTAALDDFRSGEVPLLVASDVAARGLDIPAVSHVFNYDIPHHAEDYVHRIGRTGRAGRAGAAFTLVGPGRREVARGDREADYAGHRMAGSDPRRASAVDPRPTARRKRRVRTGGSDRPRGRGRGSADREVSGDPRSEAVEDASAPRPRTAQPTRPARGPPRNRARTRLPLPVTSGPQRNRPCRETRPPREDRSSRPARGRDRDRAACALRRTTGRAARNRIPTRPSSGLASMFRPS